MDDVEGTGVVFDVGDDADSADVVALSDVGDVADLELHELGDLVSGNVQLDGVIDLDLGVGESDGSGIVSDDVRNLIRAQCLVCDLQQLEFGLILLQAL